MHLFLVAGVVGLASCHRARTPEEGYRRVQAAVNASDPGALFDALDQGSRWAWMTVQKSHREAYDIILSNYPEGRERERELRRFEKGATLGSARQLFIEEVGRAALDKLAKPLPDVVRLDVAGDGNSAAAVLPSGSAIALRKGRDGNWGYGALADDAEDRQKRALGDVEVVRLNAADYERAASRGAR